MLYKTKFEALVKELGSRGKIIIDEIINIAPIVEIDTNESSPTVDIANWSIDEVKNWIADKNLKSLVVCVSLRKNNT